MKYCPNCGNKLDNDSIFCDNCGNSVLDNKNDKSNTNNISNKSISDILNPILERPKLLLLIIIVLIFIIGIIFIFNSNSDSLNTFGGQEVTVNGVNFHIPEGFESNQLVGSNSKTDADFVLRSDDGKMALAFIHIRVSDNISPSSTLAQDLSVTNEVINGKECVVRMNGDDAVFCAYYDSDDKAVQLNVPLSYEYNNKEYSYKDTLAEMIK